MFSSLCALAHALPPIADVWLPAPSFAFPDIASSIRTVPVPVASWFQNRYRISSCFPSAFAWLKMIPKHSPSLGHLLLLNLVLFEQLHGPLCSFCYSRCRSLLELRCFALHSLLISCLCLYSRANDSPNLPCLSLQMFFNKTCWVGCKPISTRQLLWYFLQEGEQSVGRGPLVVGST